MTTLPQITRSPSSVKLLLVKLFEDAVDELIADLPADGRAIELAVWKALLAVGREMLTALLSMACWRVSEPAVTATPGARLRLDGNYRLQQNTTLGTVSVPLFAFRDSDGKTHSPARKAVFPLHPACRSSVLMLEWEARLGSQLPYRQAEEALHFFTHGASSVEDTTIARHLSMTGAVIDRSWTYRKASDIAEILATQATRDAETGKPLVYLSTDAHALRRYTDETFDSSWKMINGIRMWCVDRTNGQIIHLGGEYTWGDCREVAACFRSLVADYVPQGEGAPQVVLVTDGMEWIRTWVAPEMPSGTQLILDFYHVMEHVATCARTRFGAGTTQAKSWYARVRNALIGKRVQKKKKQTTREGHRKTKRALRVRKTTHQSSDPHGAGNDLAWSLLEEHVPESAPYRKAHEALAAYVGENEDRMDYPRYRARGLQIGSGAMESLHRIASQMRLKLAGARWLAENALAVLNARLMLLAGRWADFWESDRLTPLLVEAFGVDDAS
ncbi:MAG: hypothetical protein GW911_33140 [Armatimonadetes bacterium]|nr:hypothetical protein [Armatimonadota bacterium]